MHRGSNRWKFSGVWLTNMASMQEPASTKKIADYWLWWVLIIPNLWCHNLRDESGSSTFQLFLMFTIVLGCWFNIQLGKTQENGSFLWDLFFLYAPISVFIRFPQRPASFPSHAILVKRRASFNIINLKISSSILALLWSPRWPHANTIISRPAPAYVIPQLHHKDHIPLYIPLYPKRSWFW